MIYITSIHEVGERDAKLLSDYRIGKIKPKKHINDRLQGIAASLLLSYALRKAGISEKEQEYSENEFGKPFLKNCRNIKFSLSHSGEYAVCAVSENDIGVDIESVRNDADVLKIAKRYFTENEYNHIKEAGDSKSAFFALWTRKESLLKALGKGISEGLKKYEVLSDSVNIMGKNFRFSEFDTGDSKITCCTENAAEGQIKFLKRSELLGE